jgi:hypothetical protein
VIEDGLFNQTTRFRLSDKACGFIETLRDICEDGFLPQLQKLDLEFTFLAPSPLSRPWRSRENDDIYGRIPLILRDRQEDRRSQLWFTARPCEQTPFQRVWDEADGKCKYLFSKLETVGLGCFVGWRVERGLLVALRREGNGTEAVGRVRFGDGDMVGLLNPGGSTWVELIVGTMTFVKDSG